MWYPRSYPPEFASLIPQWKAQQDALRAKVIFGALDPLPRFVAGVDAAFVIPENAIFAAAVVYDRIEQAIVERLCIRREVSVPYIPGFLSFREGPAVGEAIGLLKHEFGVIIFDGQGIAHPRGCGIATHMGVTLDLPAVGAAKSRLFGRFEDPSEPAGSQSALCDKVNQIGVVLRTKKRTRPLFISVGHRIDLDSAVKLVLSCCTTYRLPEPTRQADQLCGLKREMHAY